MCVVCTVGQDVDDDWSNLRRKWNSKCVRQRQRVRPQPRHYCVQGTVVAYILKKLLVAITHVHTLGHVQINSLFL